MAFTIAAADQARHSGGISGEETMSFSKFARRAALAIAALTAGIAGPAAIAQTSTMAPMSTMAPNAPTATMPSKKTVAAGKLAAGQKFTSVAAAQSSCPTDTVVWSSFTSTHSFHLSTSKYYGKTKHGAYVCRQAALAAGYHQSKT